jgi:dTDP-4-dehydrorhamnose reductase
MLGTAFCCHQKFKDISIEILKSTKNNRIDITDAEKLLVVVSDFKPELIINCAAYTDVDGAESNDKINRLVNVTGIENICRAALKTNAFLLHFSTDYVFGGTGNTPWKENDALLPQGKYSLAKADGEKAIQDTLPVDRFLIIRTSWLFGPGGKNFVKTICRVAQEKSVLKVVDDQKGAPTYTEDLATASLALLEAGASEVLHFSNTGAVTWKEFAEKIIEKAGLNCKVEAISSQKSGRLAPRPAFSVLNLEKYFQVSGTKPKCWEIALSTYLKSIKD